MSQEKGKGHLTGLFAKHMVFVRRNCTLEQFTKKRIGREFIYLLPVFHWSGYTPQSANSTALLSCIIACWVSAWEVRSQSLPCGIATTNVEVEGLLGIGGGSNKTEKEGGSLGSPRRVHEVSDLYILLSPSGFTAEALRHQNPQLRLNAK